MGGLFRALVEPRTYRQLLFLITAALLAPLWFGLLLAGWLLALLTALTPLVVPVLIALRTLTWLAAAVEAALARELLGVDVHLPGPAAGPKGYLGRIRGVLGDQALWKEQSYLLLRMLLGGTIAIAILSAFAASLGMLATPISYRFGDGPNFGSWHVDTLLRALPFVPAGLVGLLVSAALVRPAAALWSRLAVMLLDDRSGASSEQGLSPLVRFVLPFHAAVFAGLNLLLVVIWALTSHRYFWPEWAFLPLGLLLAIHAWAVLVENRPRIRRIAGGRALPIEAGVAAALSAFFTLVWSLTDRAYFWPVWPMIAFATILLAHLLATRPSRRGRSLAERIDVLTSTRAGAVDAAEGELRRIERDLHDGAQARLVALGMSLGMAEQKLASDPEAARQLLAEARTGAGAALKELRDLARGIHPPILADRGLESAIAALAAATPLLVDLSVDVADRPASTVESAAYFVAAEALANAAKHARATRVVISATRVGGTLTVEVTDDGCGGAAPSGPGLDGIRKRVEALDGALTVTSPVGGPTTVKAVLPCAS